MRNVLDWWNPQNLNEKQILKFITMIALGLKYLHFQKIIHTDVKPENIFLFPNGVFKIGDLGLSRKVNMNS